MLYLDKDVPKRVTTVVRGAYFAAGLARVLSLVMPCTVPRLLQISDVGVCVCVRVGVCVWRLRPSGRVVHGKRMCGPLASLRDVFLTYAMRGQLVSVLCSSQGDPSSVCVHACQVPKALPSPMGAPCMFTACVTNLFSAWQWWLLLPGVKARPSFGS